MLFEDATQPNRKLIHDLNERVEVESSWGRAGNVWAKLHTGHKVKFTIKDNLDQKLSEKRKPI